MGMTLRSRRRLQRILIILMMAVAVWSGQSGGTLNGTLLVILFCTVLFIATFGGGEGE